MAKQVFLHVGAHRTGTSSFQLCLAANRAVLQGRGFDLAYPARDGQPGGELALRLPRPNHGIHRVSRFAADLAQHLSELSPDPGRGLILSDENVPGMMRQFYDGQFYPAAEARLAVLAQALDGPPRHVLLVVREYAKLYASAYRKRSEDNPVPDFATLAPRFLTMDRGWPELVQLLRDRLRPVRLTVLPYGARGESRDLLRRLVPDLTGVDLAEPTHVLNQSATDAALLALQARYRAGEVLRRRAWQAVIAAHAEDRAPRGYAVFGDESARVLADRYATDLERIAALDGVEMAA